MKVHIPIEICDKEFHSFVIAYNKKLFKYINNFLGLKCSSDILARKLFPNGKEITETAAVFEAVWMELKLDLQDPEINLFSVGDGNTPRSAAYFAFRTKWICHSIDPNLKLRDWETDRLKCYQDKIEELDFNVDKAVIIAVHSHAPMDLTLEHIQAKERHLIAMPCCIPWNDSEPDIQYRDRGVWSPKNLIKIWKDI